MMYFKNKNKKYLFSIKRINYKEKWGLNKHTYL